MRLAIRNEGTSITAYLCPNDDSLWHAETVASIKTHVARAHPVVFEAWKAALTLLAEQMSTRLADERGEADGDRHA